LPAVLYGHETWSLILKEEHRLKICENGVLRRISGPKRVERIGGRRTVHDEKLNNFYSSSYISRMNEVKDKMGRACRRHG
jgi:hypothetical protein